MVLQFDQKSIQPILAYTLLKWKALMRAYASSSTSYPQRNALKWLSSLQRSSGRPTAQKHTSTGAFKCPLVMRLNFFRSSIACNLHAACELERLTDGLRKACIGALTASLFLVQPAAALFQDCTPNAVHPQPAASQLLPIPSEFAPLADIQELPIQDVTLSNGLRVFLIEDHEVPLVKGSIAIRGGQRASPADMVGLASIAAALQRSGGSVDHPGPELDDTLEQMAAGIEGGAIPEALVLGFQCLKEDTAQVTGLLSELLTSPALPEDKLQLYKGQVLNLLEHQNDNASSIPRRELAKLIYGPESVYARSPKHSQIASIRKADIESFIKQWERPDAAVMGVLGDFDSIEMERVLEGSLGKWRADSSQPKLPNPVPSSPLPEQPGDSRRLFLIDRPGATQASVAMGEIGVSISDPDTPALDILNEILNSFGGRLFNEIRSKEGLAYTVSGGFNTNAVDHRGLFVAGGETAAVGDFLSALERVLQEATVVPPTSSVLDAAKARTLNSFVFNFSSTEAQLQRLIGFTLVGLPQDYLFSYRNRIQAVTAEDVLGAAKRHLHPLEQQVVVVADADASREQFALQGRTVVPLILDDA